MTVSGECFCGAVTYAIDGTLREARSCHCSRCRKVFGGQASAYALVTSDEFKWLTGEDNLTTHLTTGGFGLRFCSTCGSTLCGVHNGTVHGVTLGCVNGDPGVVIEQHIFVGSKAAWEVMPDGVTAFQDGPPAAK